MTDHEHEILDDLEPDILDNDDEPVGEEAPDFDLDDDLETGDEPDMVLVGTKDAAKVYGCAVRTVTKRIGEGIYTATKINGAWFVEVPRAAAKAKGIPIPDIEENAIGPDISKLPIVGTQRKVRSSEIAVADGSSYQAIDLAPIAELTATLHRQVVELTAAVATLEERNRTLEEQGRSATLALESGQQEIERKIDEAKAQAKAEAEQELSGAVETARKEAADQRDAEWRAKSWWQRLKGE